MVVCIALDVDDVSRGSLSALIYPGDRVTWKILTEYSWSPTTTQSDSFLCTTASSTPIRVVTKEVRYIHELFLTLEHSTPVSSPAVPGLTSPRALYSRVMQASSATEDVRRVPRKLLECSVWATSALDASGAG